MRIYVTLAVLATAVVSNAQFVNGNFETGDFTGWTIGLTSQGANALQQVIDFDIDGPGAIGITKGAQFSAGRAAGVTTGEHGVTLTQLLSLSSGTQYTFEFDWAATRTAGQGANSQGGIFALTVNGVEVNRSAAGSTSAALPKYGHHIGTYTPTSSGSFSVGVSIIRPFTIPSPAAPTLFQTVDNFTMNPPVPEPTTMAALGIGALALIRRRRQAK